MFFNKWRDIHVTGKYLLKWHRQCSWWLAIITQPLLQWVHTVIGLGGQFVVSVCIKYLKVWKKIWRGRLQVKHKELMTWCISTAMTPTLLSTRVEIFTYFLSQSQHKPVWNIKRALMRQMHLFVHCTRLLSTHKALGALSVQMGTCLTLPQMSCTSSHVWQDTLICVYVCSWFWR